MPFATGKSEAIVHKVPSVVKDAGPYDRRITAFLVVYFAICMFLNYGFSDDGFVSGANLAEIVLILFGVVAWLRSPRLRPWRGSRWELYAVSTVLAYLLVRILLSFETQYFVRYVGKLFLLVGMVFAYHIFSMERRLFAYMSWLLPGLYALAVAIRLAILLAQGQLGATRLEIPPYRWEYVGGIAGFLFGFLIYRWSQQKMDWRAIPLTLITVFVLLGLFLSAVRGALLDAVVTLLCYVMLSGQAWRRRVIILSCATLVVVSFAWVYTIDNPQGNRLDLATDASAVGRVLIWQDTFRQLSANPKAAMLGFGLGGFSVDLPEISASGNYDWDSIKSATFNGFLEAWASLGVVGLFAYGLMFWCFFQRLWAIQSRKHRALLLAMLTGMLLNDMFNELWMQTRYNWLLAYMVSLFAFSSEAPPEVQPSLHRPQSSSWWWRSIRPYRDVFAIDPRLSDSHSQ